MFRGSISNDQLGCHTRVITPENIAFQYVLAGPFQRLPAFALDLLLRAIVIVILLLGGFFLMAWLNLLPAMGSMFGFVFLVSVFGLSWFYGIFFETYFNGRTPGKKLMRLRVISVDGRPINGLQATLRNVLRSADMNVMLSVQIFSHEAPPYYFIPTMTIGLVSMLLTARMQRVGDLAAGTMVVVEARRLAPASVPIDDVRAYGLAELIPANFQVGSSLAQALGLYMENRKRLKANRREEVAGLLARPLIQRFQLLPDTSHDLLLCALYVRSFLTEKQRQQGVLALRGMHPAISAGPSQPAAYPSTVAT
ncbi:MAG: RDD family protein [Pirellulaceae bacterium]|nr:RDD family protein [Pirellulaceae bacterium]